LIKRAKRHERFYIVSHALIDSEISAEALGVAVYVLSRPDDWIIRPTQIRKKFNCGKERMTRILTEIVALGYATKEKARSTAGTFDGCNWTFYESPHPNYPATVKPATDNPTLLNKDNNLIRNLPTSTDDFGMFIGWQPTPIFSDLLTQSGIDVVRIPNEVRDELVGEFISYWLSQPERKHSQSKWHHKLRQQFIQRREKGVLYTVVEKERRLRDVPILESLTDRSWAAGLVLDE
jgi:hypothetical protein